LDGVRFLVKVEAQYVEDIGRKVKLLIDEVQPLHIIITGSSSFGLEKKSEPLLGRKHTYQLFPIAQCELKKHENMLQTRQNLDDRLVYGCYPELLSLGSNDKKTEYLSELVNTLLLKDILAFEEIRNAQKLKELLKLIAHQVGAEVSEEELGRQLGIGKNTVARYLDLLSKVFIIFSRQGYSRNLRKEIVKSKKWYFYDNGIRNAIISNFNLVPVRTDIGMLWENYFIAERLKRNSYLQNYINSYFWRTYDQQEIDLIEVQNEKLTAFECKWQEQKIKIPGAFAKAYPDSSFQIIHKENYLTWIED